MRSILIGFVLFLTCAAAIGEELGANAILKSTDLARGGGLPGITWNVKVSAKEDGSIQNREITVKASDENSLIEFTAPVKVRGQRMLMLGRNMWFSQPGLQRPVPISPRQRLSGQAANGDIASTNYAGDYTATVAGEESLDGDECHVLDLSAKNKTATYDRITYWISKKSRLGLKADFFTVSGKKFKSAAFEYRNRITYQGRTLPFISKMVIMDAINNANTTTLEYDGIRIGSIPASEFNVNLLVR